MLLVTAEEMRNLDRLTIEKYGTPGHVLMERAGAGATKALLEMFPHMRRKGRRALIVAGKGNNGGDGFVIARHLLQRGTKVEVFLIGRTADVSGDALRNLKAYRRGGGKIAEIPSGEHLALLAERLDGADLVIDAIFGTGLANEVRGVHAETIELLNASGIPLFAVDMPSGLNADTGIPLGACIQAEATATFAFAKVGQVVFPGASYVGRLAVIDIGIAAEAINEQPPSAELLDAPGVAALVPQRRPDAHKGDCGHLLVIAGSFGKTGAAQLVARAALRTGAGLVTLVGPASLYSIYAGGVIEAMTEVLPDRDGRLLFDARALARLIEGKTAIAIGPGIGTHEDAQRTVAWLLTKNLPIVLDADALSCIARDLSVLVRAAGDRVLTPHPGEMARLIAGDAAAVQQDRFGVARRFAREHRCTLVLKGARSVIADGNPTAEPSVAINSAGNPGMASGGMGDVLTGIIGGLLAQRLTAGEAARLGVYLHARVADDITAERGEIGLVASDIIEQLPPGMKHLRELLPTEA